jgi:hypothetical protein
MFGDGLHGKELGLTMILICVNGKNLILFFKIKKLGHNSFLDRVRSLRTYRLTKASKINTWDYQWDFCCRERKGISIIPSCNLIENLGIGGGTHTSNYKSEKILKKRNMKITGKRGNNLEYNESYRKFFLKGFLKRMSIFSWLK